MIEQKHITRFWSKVARGEPNACWLWTKSPDSMGYGQFQVNKKRYRAHRFAFLITHGTLPDELDVLHNCPNGDNKACVNPAHLFLGTHTDNMRDARDKGQLRPCTGEDHYSYLHPEKVLRGEDHPFVKNPELVKWREEHARWNHSINEEQVKLLYSQGWTQKKIAELFSCTQQLISAIIRNKRVKDQHNV